MVVLYGIKNCDTVKKARDWLDKHGIAYQFHDYRVDGLTSEQLQRFVANLGWDTMLNRSSTSWRQLSAEQQDGLTEAKAIELMLDTPTLIKRPILNTGSELLIGFKLTVYQAKLL
ncbi:ArsC family reductase [Methyloglobulus sp.]|uniref:ArsC family reductase n=1 Tax=Methyloglobulus sp. TaxID=2518622 RepID=UPI003988AD53